MSEQAAKPRRRVWPWIVLVPIAIWGVVILPFALYSYRFQNSAMIGLTPQQVMERCGEPVFASSQDYESRNGGRQTIVWGRMDDSTRRDLQTAKDLLFGYRGWAGDQFSVYFENGTVNRVVRSSK